jgi:ATP-dependent Clp protease protease subunit
MGRQSKSSMSNRCDGDCGDGESQVYQQSQSDRIIYLSGNVTEGLIAQVIAGILSLSGQSEKPITLLISTDGGSVDEMFGLYDVMKYVSAPIRTVGVGKVMSAGVLLLAAGEKGKRLIGANSRIMLHSISASISGNIFDITNESAEMVRQQDQMMSLLCKETAMNKKQLEKIMKLGHNYFIDATEAVSLGIVDKIIGD